MTDNPENDGRLSFKEAVAYVMQKNQAAFIAMPVFGERTDDEQQTAEGARVFIIEPDGEGDWQMRFIAGPFFSAAYAANDIIVPEEVPDVSDDSSPVSSVSSLLLAGIELARAACEEGRKTTIE